MIADKIPNPCPLTLIAREAKTQLAGVRNLAKRLGCNVRSRGQDATVSRQDALRIFNEIQAISERNVAKQLKNIQTEAISKPITETRAVMQMSFVTLADIAKSNNISKEKCTEILDKLYIKPSLYPDEDTAVPLFKDKVIGRVERFLIEEAAAEQARREAEERAAAEQARREAEERAAEEERKHEEEEKRKAEETAKKSAELHKETSLENLSKITESVGVGSDGLTALLSDSRVAETIRINERYCKTLVENGLDDAVYRQAIEKIGLMNMLNRCMNDNDVENVGCFKRVPLWLAKAAKQRDSAVVAQVVAAGEIAKELMVTNALLRDLLNLIKENVEHTRRLADALGGPQKNEEQP